MATTRSDKGISLAKAPVALLGLAMVVYGIAALIAGGDGFDADPFEGTVTGETLLGIEGNGWTNLLWIGSGALLLLAAPMHWGAKTMALVVGIALGIAALIALSDGTDALGIFAADDGTKIAWGACSVALLLFALLPRVGGHGDEREDSFMAGYRARERELERERADRFGREAEAERRPGPVGEPGARRREPIE
jgi:hypothetical protein